MIRKSIASCALSGAALLLASSALGPSAQAHPAHDADDDGFEEIVGSEYMVMEVSTDDVEARDRFHHGLALLHNFEYGSAAKSFRKAQEADPDFVMAYWGEAMTYNHPLWDQQDRDAALEALARLGATPAERAAKARSPREAQWLGAVETLYGEGEKKARDLAYLATMRALHDADPSDIDARAFTGLAILGSSHGGRQVPIYMEAAGMLEVGFVQHPNHPGILHYLIHSYDDPVHAPLGLRAARSYANVAPDAGHAQHMVSHIFNALGMWQESEYANINADSVVDRQRVAAGREPTSCGHYNEWLVYALLQQGKDARGVIDGCRTQAEAELATIIANGGEGNPRAAYSYADMELRYGIETGDWRAPLDFAPASYAGPRFDFANAAMLASLGDADKSAAALMALEKQAAANIALVKQYSAGDDQYTPWIDAAVAQGKAINALSAGDTEGGLAMLRAAAANEAALPTVFGPPAIRKPSYELLGEVLLDLGRKDEAAEAFRASLAFAPRRRLSLAGLEAATSE
jgi:tetratricopeptide (TPR) repeat protein